MSVDLSAISHVNEEVGEQEPEDVAVLAVEEITKNEEEGEEEEVAKQREGGDKANSDETKGNNKRKAKEAAKRKKEGDDRRKKEDAEQRKKEKVAAEKRKEAEKLRKEAAVKAAKAEKEKEKRRASEEANTQAEERRQAKKEKRQRRRQPKPLATEEEERLEGVWDEETGLMRSGKARGLNDRNYVEDVCCEKSPSRHSGCRCFSFFLYLIVFPALYGGLVWLEYEAYGLTRWVAWSGAQDWDPALNNSTTVTTRVEETSQEEGEGQQLPKNDLPDDFLQDYPLSWGLPAIGLVFGVLANIVPLAPGLVLMPLFQELQVTKTDADTLALSFWVQIVGSGLFGFVSWCCRDARLFVCRALFLLPVFADLGYLVGVTKHWSAKDLLLGVEGNIENERLRREVDKSDIALLHTYIRIGFAVFMMFMSFWVLLGVCMGGVNRYCCPSFSGGSTPGCKSFCQWIIVLLCAFNTGWLLVANIGCGMGVTSFFTLCLFLGVETKRAMPTAIAVGAWTLVLPATLELAVFEAFPYIRLLMCIPGLWLGSLLAPWFSKCGGPMSDLSLYFLALITTGTVVMCFAAIAIDNKEGGAVI